jgi:hypothetical protein
MVDLPAVMPTREKEVLWALDAFVADDVRRSMSVEAKHEGDKSASRFAELRAEHRDEAQLLGALHAIDPANDKSKLLHKEELRYLKDQMQAETLGLHWELKGNTEKARELYDRAARHQHCRAELRNSFMIEPETFGVELVQQIRNEPHSRAMREIEVQHSIEACSEERSARGFPTALEEPEHLTLENITAEAQKLDPRIANTSDLIAGNRMINAADAAIDAAALADRLESVDMRHAAQFRYESSRAIDSARLHLADFRAEQGQAFEVLKDMPNMTAAALDAVADVAGSIMDGIASAFESLFGGAAPRFTVQHVHIHTRGDGLSR